MLTRVTEEKESIAAANYQQSRVIEYHKNQTKVLQEDNSKLQGKFKTGLGSRSRRVGVGAFLGLLESESAKIGRLRLLKNPILFLYQNNSILLLTNSN